MHLTENPVETLGQANQLPCQTDEHRQAELREDHDTLDRLAEQQDKLITDYGLAFQQAVAAEAVDVGVNVDVLITDNPSEAHEWHARNGDNMDRKLLLMDLWDAAHRRITVDPDTCAVTVDESTHATTGATA